MQTMPILIEIQVLVQDIAFSPEALRKILRNVPCTRVA